MKKKLLFWTNVFMLHFSLSYYLQQKLDDDFYAIIDVPSKPKKFFQNQKIVNFKKTWDYNDQIKKTSKKPDLEYLKKFEKKYKINLWKMAINERHFYKFNRFYKFTNQEILTILEQECKFFEKILDEIEPDYFLTYDPPFHHSKLLLEMCKSKGVKILCLYFTRIGSTTILAEDGGTLDFPQNIDTVELDKKEEDRLKEKYILNKKTKSYSTLTKNYKNERGATSTDKLKALIDYILISDSKNIQSNYTYYGRTKFKVILDTLGLSIKRQIRANHIQKNQRKTVDLNIPFTYFPLNIEEELSMLHYAPFFTNQMEVLRHIAKSLPINHKLYVKEHTFAEFRGWHKISEYEEMMDIPNLILVHPSYPSDKLVKHSKLVVTVRGTASFDAAIHNKPSIIFGDIPFTILPSVYKVKSLTELPSLIKTALETPINPQNVLKYFKLMEERSIDFSMMDYEVIRNNQFYSGNTLSDVDISEKDTKEFLDRNSHYFESLIKSHLTKIIH